ncbi:MAG: PDZ domain-containing protein [Planctomycetota bacterium]
MRYLVIAFVGMLWALPASARVEPAVSYRVDLSQRAQQIVTIEADVPVIDGSAEIVLPVWRPGRYGVLDFAATIREYQAVGSDGEPARVEKVRKNVWKIDTPAESATFRYSIFADSLGDRTRHADDSHVFLSGSSVFVMSPPHRWDEHHVSIGVPDGWSVATGLERADNAWVAPDYDTLIDSPFEIGTHQSHSFEVEGVRTEVAIFGDVEPDWELIERDFGSVARVQHTIFGGSVHFDRYVYLIHAYPGGRGGTEHLNSTVCQTSPETFQDEERWKRFMSLIAHEYFHTWNVKKFRPAELVPYELAEEDYTRMLWLVEGSTSYYDDLTLVRGGIIEPDDYLEMLATSTASMEQRAGRQRSSLTESSFDAWLKFWGPSSPDHSNTSVNFYTHGAMASLALDLLLREASGGTGSYDSVMRWLNERFQWRQRGYTLEDVIDASETAAGQPMGWFFDRHITGRELPPMDRALLLAGIERVGDTSEARVLFGATTTSDSGGCRVTRLLAGSPAFEAGLNIDDIIVAIDGQSVIGNDIDEMLDSRTVGETIRIVALRREAIREFQVPLFAEAPVEFSYARVATPTEAQRRMYEAWLSQPWPDERPDEGTD